MCASSLIISCSSKTNKEQDNSTISPEQKTALYQCPMQCEGDKTYDKPGKCPVCGMDLQPVESKSPATPDTSHAHDSVRAV